VFLVVSFLLSFPPIPYVHSSSPPFVLHAMPISSNNILFNFNLVVRISSPALLIPYSCRCVKPCSTRWSKLTKFREFFVIMVCCSLLVILPNRECSSGYIAASYSTGSDITSRLSWRSFSQSRRSRWLKRWCFCLTFGRCQFRISAGTSTILSPSQVNDGKLP
jgi:hypothetical protein